jgi:hypothetical protein
MLSTSVELKPNPNASGPALYLRMELNEPVRPIGGAITLQLAR